MRVPLQVLRKSTSSQTTVFRILCLLTEAVFHDWLGSYDDRSTGHNAHSPWNRPDRIWLGTNSHPPLSSGITTAWSPGLTRKRRQLKARKASQEYRGRLIRNDPAVLKARQKRDNDRRKEARKAGKAPDLDDSAQKLATRSNQISVIEYFEDNPVKFMAHLLKWRGVSLEDQAAMIKSDNRPLLEREAAYTMTLKEYRKFYHVIHNKHSNALRAAARKSKAKNASTPVKATQPVRRKRTTVSAQSYTCHFNGCKRAKSGFPRRGLLKKHLMSRKHDLSEKEAMDAIDANYRPEREGGPHKCLIKSCRAAKIGFAYPGLLRQHLKLRHKFSTEQSYQLVPTLKLGNSATQWAVEQTLRRPEMEALAEQLDKAAGTADTGSGTHEAMDEEDIGVEAAEDFQDDAGYGSLEADHSEDMDIDEDVNVQNETGSGQPFVRLSLKSRGRPGLICLEEERRGAALDSKSGKGSVETFTRLELKSRPRPKLVSLDQRQISKVVKPKDVKTKSGPVPEKHRGLKQLSLSNWLA